MGRRGRKKTEKEMEKKEDHVDMRTVLATLRTVLATLRTVLATLRIGRRKKKQLKQSISLTVEARVNKF